MEMLEQFAHETLGPGRRGTPRARASRRPGHKAH
jgi:hypothetical protein